MQSIELVSETSGTHAHTIKAIIVATVFQVTIVDEIVIEIIITIVKVLVALSSFGLLVTIITFFNGLLVFFASGRTLALLFLLGLHLVAAIFLHWSQRVVVFDPCNHCFDQGVKAVLASGHHTATLVRCIVVEG